MKSCSLFVRTAEPVNLFYFHVIAVPGVGWGMHGGEEELLSKSSGLDVHVQNVMEFTAPSPPITSPILKDFLNVSGEKGG